MIAHVFADIPALRLDKYFSYSVPAELEEAIRPGHRVAIPFGGREVEGFVYHLVEGEQTGLKPVLRILDRDMPALTPELLELGLWLSERYLCPVSLAFKSMIPGALKNSRRPQVVWQGDDLDLASLADSYPALGDFLNKLATEGTLPLAQVRKGIGEAGLALLEETGLIQVYGQYQLPRPKAKRYLPSPQADIETIKKQINRSPRQVEAFFWLWERGEAGEDELKAEFKGLNLKRMIERGWIVEANPEPEVVSGPQLTPAQEAALSIMAGKGGEYLLHGITGSGKTEVYLQLIEMELKNGRSAIVLVPEIGLTEHLVDTFRQRLGGSLAVWHSRMNPSEKAEVWKRVREGEARVVLGPRSAIFAPFEDLGVIIIDEEQEPAYKQEENPRYHAAEVARWRAKRHQALLVYGSATPSLELYHRAVKGEIELISLTERIGGRPLPEIEIVDMREELRAGNRTMFSRRLVAELQGVLQRGEQAIIFLNRRGFSRFVLCRSCGYRVDCPSCSVAMTYHQSLGRMVCHYCGATAEYPQICPACGSRYIREFGAGTERVEQELTKIFPTARIARMDLDTTRGKNSHRLLIDSVKKGDIDILVGTQMVAKGFDFPLVSLVGVLAADTLFNIPDFRASERAFQLLVQVAGRSGRGETPGRVIIQCYDPEYPALNKVKTQDYQGFYQSEIEERKLLNYPPCGHLIKIVAWAEERTAAQELIGRAHRRAMEYLSEHPSEVEILGPAPCPIFRLRGQFRYGLTLKANDMGLLLPIGKYIIEGKKTEGRLEIDVDPLLMY